VRPDGRWYGRGTTDCKGNIVAHLTTLRALRAVHGCDLPCTIKFLCEGSEESGDGALEKFVPANADLVRADAVCWADLGNFVAGEPTLTTSLRGLATVDVRLDALAQGVHSGTYGGPAPDPVAGLVSLLASLHDERGDTTIDSLTGGGGWSGADYPAERFRGDANVLDGVELLGSGEIADMLWARPAATVIGIDVPTIADSVPSVLASAAARVSLRFPPGITASQAADALANHLKARVPWNLRCSIGARSGPCEPYIASLEGRAHDTLARALEKGFGAPVTTGGEGGSNPLVSVFAQTFPETEIMLYGIEEPKSSCHAPNESVDPRQIERVALSQAFFLEEYAR
jgi:acetylornithine deacetylase/succinyl-diaminopimelate desuccinylase-like protein